MPRWILVGEKLVPAEEVEAEAPADGFQVRVVDEAHVSHALPRKQDAPGMDWNKFDRAGRPAFSSNRDVREFQRRNPSFARG